MKRLYELISRQYENNLFFEIEWNEEQHILTTYEGNITHYYNLKNQAKKKSKKYKHKEEAQKTFEKYCQEYENKGYILPDYEFPSKTWSQNYYNENFKVKEYFYLSYSQEDLDKIMEQTHLKSLIIEDCQKKLILPETLCNLKNLEYLHIKGLNNLPENIGKLKKLRELHIEKTSMTQLPESIVECESLEFIVFPHNPIQSLPQNIGKLKNLKLLDCGYTHITELPESIADCENLHTIDAAQCEQLQKFPSNFGKLKKLVHLDIRDCNLTVFPIEVTQLENLEELKLTRNKISKLPPEIAKMKGLKRLSLFSNKGFKEFPEAFFKLQNLYYLDLGYSGIEDIPKGFLKMKKLKDIEVVSTPFYDKKFKKWGLNRDDLLKYFHVDPKEDKPSQELAQTIEDNKQFYNELKHLSENPFLRKKPNKTEKTFLERFKKDPKAYLHRCSYQHKDAKAKAIAILVHFIPEAFALYAEDWFFSKDATFNITNLQAFCLFNPEKYEPFLLRTTQLSSSIHEQVSIHIALYSTYGEKYRNATIQAIQTYLENFTEWRINKWDFFLPIPKEQRRPLEAFRWITQHFKNEVKEPIFKNAKIQSLNQHTKIFFECLLESYETETIELLTTDFIQENRCAKIAFELLEGYDYSQHYDKVWTFLGSGQRDLAIQKLKGLYTPEELFKRGKKWLTSDSINERGGAAELLMNLENPKVKGLLKKAFKTEYYHENLMILTSYFLKENDKKVVKDVLKKALAKETKHANRVDLIEHLVNLGEQAFIKQETLNAFEQIKGTKKLSKPPKKWLDKTQLPDLFWKNGKKVDPLFMRFLFQNQNRKEGETYKVLQENALTFEDFDREKSTDFAHQLLSLIIQKEGIKATGKALTPIAATLGDERVAKALQKYAIDRKSEFASNLLSNMYSPEAARAANNIILHFKSKYPNVNSAASNSLESIAQNLGITRMELLDSIIPDFGFTDLFKPVEIEDKKYRAFITTDFKLAYLDELDKIKKSLPSKASKELKTEIKNLNKDIKAMAKEQKISLEYYMINARSWNTKDWKNHFMKKPLMFAFAQGLIWGIEQKNKLVETFAVSQDQTLETPDFEEITLPKDAHIRIIHPVEIDDEKRQIWQEYLESNKIKQAFEQMYRPAFTPQDIDAINISENLEGEKIPDYSFRYTMSKFGWRIGEVVDAGYIHDYYKEYDDGTIATLETKEAHVDSGLLSHAVLNRFYFDSAIKDISPLIFSETIYDLDRLLQKAE